MRKTIALLLILIVISCFIFAEGNTEQMDQDESLTTLFAELVEQQQYKQDHYYELAQPTQVLETLYTALGPDVVSYVEYEVPETPMQVIKIWYPSELAENTYPAVLFVQSCQLPIFRFLESEV